MANNYVPKIKVDKKKFKSMLTQFDLTYGRLSKMHGIDRTSQTILRNVNDGKMPIHTALSIAKALKIDIETFTLEPIHETEIIELLLLLNPEQKNRLYYYLKEVIESG